MPLSGATEKDSFKVALIYYAGEDAGALVELDEDDYATTSTGLKIKNLKREAIVCVAKAVDLKKEYKISKAIVLDGKTSTQGTLSIQVDSKSVSKTTYGKTVKVTATAKSGYSIVSVIIIDDASGKTISHSQSGSTYQFNMPAGDVTVKMSLKKTTSSTKNPGSGDTSNIYLWAGVLGVSIAALVALLAIWFWKRRK